MKKLLIATILSATTIFAANAIPAITPANTTQSLSNNAYHVGYHHGKSDAYNNTARTLFVVGAVAIAGVLIYHLGEDSRWGFTNDGQVAYRF